VDALQSQLEGVEAKLAEATETAAANKRMALGLATALQEAAAAASDADSSKAAADSHKEEIAQLTAQLDEARQKLHSSLQRASRAEERARRLVSLNEDLPGFRHRAERQVVSEAATAKSERKLRAVWQLRARLRRATPAVAVKAVRAWLKPYRTDDDELRTDEISSFVYDLERRGAERATAALGEILSVRRVGHANSFARVSGRQWNRLRNILFKILDDDGNHVAREIFPGRFGKKPIPVPTGPSAATSRAHLEKSRRDAGLGVEQAEDGVIAYRDFVNAANLALDRSKALGLSKKPDGEPDRINISADAGNAARNTSLTIGGLRDGHCTESCRNDVFIPLVVALKDDSKMREIMRPMAPAINEVARSGVLPPPSLGSGANGSRDDADGGAAACGGAQCTECAGGGGGDEVDVCMVCSTCSERVRGRAVLVTQSGDYKNISSNLGLGAHNTTPELFNSHVYRDSPDEEWKERSLDRLNALSHSLIGVACPKCNWIAHTAAERDAELERLEELFDEPDGKAALAHAKSHENVVRPPAFQVEPMNSFVAELHFEIDTFKLPWHIYWRDIEDLHPAKEAALMRYDVLVALKKYKVVVRVPSRRRHDRGERAGEAVHHFF